MKKRFNKKILLGLPLIILVIMLVFINYTISFFRDTVYDYVFDTNEGSIRRFSQEIEELNQNNDDYDLYSKVHVYNKTFGNKAALVSFFVGSNAYIYYSNDENRAFMSPMLEKKENLDKVLSAPTSGNSGKISLDNRGDQQRFYFQTVTDGRQSYYIFMTVDKNMIYDQLNANTIVIPIFIVGLLLIIFIEYFIWLKITNGGSKQKKE